MKQANMVSLFLFCYTYKEVTGLRAYGSFRVNTQHICKVSIFLFTITWAHVFWDCFFFLLEAFSRLYHEWHFIHGWTEAEISCLEEGKIRLLLKSHSGAKVFSISPFLHWFCLCVMFLVLHVFNIDFTVDKVADCVSIRLSFLIIVGSKQQNLPKIPTSL